MPDSERTFRDKMLERIQKAEALDEQIAEWEKWAENRVPKGLSGDLHALEVRKTLELKAVYKNLVGARNSNLQWAEVYGLAALVDLTLLRQLDI